MCLALPYRIVTLLNAGRAVAEGPGGAREIDISLLGQVAPGAYVLVTYGSATGVVDPDEAAEILSVWQEIELAGGDG
jgi:hydrogenase assembly chaperone HypC/HupF